MEFSQTPLAAASIAQVHLAISNSGKKMVVKVQRPGIEKSISQDLAVLKEFASFIDHHTKYGKLYDFSKMVQEFENNLNDELDFRTEGENAEIFKENFLHDKGVRVPQISWIHTTKRVLSMEYIDGIKINDFNEMEKAGIDRKIIARNLVESMFQQILRDGFFHGDPHPGNIMVLPNNEIVFLDLGMLGRLNNERKSQFLKMLLGITLKNSRLIIQAMIGLDVMANQINLKRLEKEIDLLRNKYLTIPLSEIKIGEVFNEVFALAFSHKIKIPSEFTMLAKSLVTLEGLVEELDPDVNIMEIAEPIANKLIFTTFSPQKTGQEIVGGILDYASLIKELPSFLINYIRALENDEFAVQVHIKDINRIEKRIDRVAIRNSLGLILVSLSIFSSGILIWLGKDEALFADLYDWLIISLKSSLVLGGLIIIGLIISAFFYKKPK